MNTPMKIQGMPTEVVTAIEKLHTPLLPCPFCGSYAKTYCDTVTCSNPICKMHFAAVPKMHTTEEWNRRDSIGQRYKHALEDMEEVIAERDAAYSKIRECTAILDECADGYDETRDTIADLRSILPENEKSPSTGATD